MIYVLQKFNNTPLGIRQHTLHKRCPLNLMVDMLKDPDYTDQIDWSGVSPSPPGKYNAVTSGTWYKDVKVSRIMTSCDVILYHVISHRHISNIKARMSSFVLLSWDPTPHTSRSRARRRRTMCTLRPEWCTLSIVKKWTVRRHIISYDIMWYQVHW